MIFPKRTPGIVKIESRAHKPVGNALTAMYPGRPLIGRSGGWIKAYRGGRAAVCVVYIRSTQVWVLPEAPCDVISGHVVLCGMPVTEIHRDAL